MARILNIRKCIEDKEELEYLKSQCDLIIGNYDSRSGLNNCYGYPDECNTCEVTKNISSAKSVLAKLLFTEELSPLNKR